MQEGRYYFLGCMTCDKDNFVSFCKFVAKTLYTNDLSEIEVKKAGHNRDKHNYTWLSVPIGDAEMIRFLGYGLKIAFTFRMPVGVVLPLSETNVQQVTFPQEFFHPIDVCMGFYMQRDLKNFTEHVSGFTYSDSFCTFMSLRLRGNYKPNDPLLENAIITYEKFHEHNNGNASQQFAMAKFIRVEIYLKKYGNMNTPCKEVLKTCAQVFHNPFMKTRACYLLGLYETDPEKQFGYFWHECALRYVDVVDFYVKKKDFNRALRIIEKVVTEDPTLENAKRFADVCCRLDLRLKARSMLRQVVPLKEVQKHMLPRSETYNIRICESCSKTGEMKNFVHCPDCNKSWYCTDECAQITKVNHRKRRCRFCYVCEQWIPKEKRRQFCSGCYDYFYCGPECQLEHWFQGGHNKECKGIKK